MSADLPFRPGVKSQDRFFRKSNETSPHISCMKPAETNSSPSRNAGVNAQYALHFWDSQEESDPSQTREQTQTCIFCQRFVVNLIPIFLVQPSTSSYHRGFYFDNRSTASIANRSFFSQITGHPQLKFTMLHIPARRKTSRNYKAPGVAYEGVPLLWGFQWEGKTGS